MQDFKLVAIGSDGIDMQRCSTIVGDDKIGIYACTARNIAQVQVVRTCTDIREGLTDIADIPQSITVTVGLVRIEPGRTVVYISTDTITINIIVRIIGTKITNIANPITITVGLIRIIYSWTVIAGICNSIPIIVRKPTST